MEINMVIRWLNAISFMFFSLSILGGMIGLNFGLNYSIYGKWFWGLPICLSIILWSTAFVIGFLH